MKIKDLKKMIEQCNDDNEIIVKKSYIDDDGTRIYDEGIIIDVSFDKENNIEMSIG